MYRLPRKKFNKQTLALKDILDKLNIYLPFHPNQENTHSSQAQMEQSPE